MDDKKIDQLLDRSEIFKEGLTLKTLTKLSTIVAEADAKAQVKRNWWIFIKKKKDTIWILFGL